MKNKSDFISSVKELLLSMKKYWKGIFIATLFAITASILTLIAPNRLTTLTDELSNGLIPQKDVLEEIANKVSNNLDEKKLNELNTKLFNIDVTKLIDLLKSPKLSEEDRKILLEIKDGNISSFSGLSNEVKFALVKDVTIDDKVIKKNDILKYFDAISKGDFKEIPSPILDMLLPSFTVKKTEITSLNQAEIISLFKDAKDVTKEELISKMDKLPKNVYDIVKPVINLDKILKITILIGSIYLLTCLFSFIEGIIICSVAIKYSKDTREKIINKIGRLPLRYFDNTTVGDLLSRVTNDVNTINSTMNDSLSSLLSAITMFVGSIIMMFSTNWVMAITAILSSCLGFVFSSKILSKSQKYFVARQTELGKLNGHIEETFSNHQVVKLYNGKKVSNEKFDELNDKVCMCERKSQFLSGMMSPIMGFIGNFGYVAVCVVGAILTMHGHISFGVIVAFMMYIRLFTNPLSEIAQALASLQSGTAASKRVFEFLNQEELPKETDVKTLLLKEAKGKIEFNHVKFGYDKSKPIIKDFSAKVKPGEKIAIVGPTGAGKTTLINLIMRFYEIDEGSIVIDGIDTRNLSRKNIHDLFIMVLQDTWLFNGTIRDNIKFNKSDVTDEELWKVCEVVGIDHFVKTLPNGLDSVINDSNNISAGQKQLLTIARGMVKNAPFLILDEATSNVDTRTEELVQIAMDKLMKGRTSFVIAHRLSTIKNADLILYLEHGDVLEQGTHEELMKLNGKYAKLYNSQFEKVK